MKLNFSSARTIESDIGDKMVIINTDLAIRINVLIYRI